MQKGKEADIIACTRCGGTGIIAEYAYYQGGRCFRCGGSGNDPQKKQLLEPAEVYRETVVAGRKVVLTTSKDLQGRFLGYVVYVDGSFQSSVTCRDFKGAVEAFRKLKAGSRGE